MHKTTILTSLSQSRRGIDLGWTPTKGPFSSQVSKEGVARRGTSDAKAQKAFFSMELLDPRHEIRRVRTRADGQ
jgi:hypothetical protein